MTWITDNWAGILLVLAFLALHVFGHRGHARGHAHGPAARPAEPGEPVAAGPEATPRADAATPVGQPAAPRGHRH